MDGRKRPRLGLAEVNTNNIRGQKSFILSNGSASLNTLPANLFLTICDEDSDDESGEFLTIDSTTLAQLKQEQDVVMPPLQYRIVNQLQSTAEQQQLHGALAATQRPSPHAHADSYQSGLPAAVQLPSGCEIYLVKEYIDAANVMTRDVTTGATRVSSVSTVPALTKTIKLEPSTQLATTAGAVQVANGSMPCLITPDKPTAGSVGVGTKEEQTGKRSFILEAYKKRDDKRRATHNEVERRRRDKINNWIFKLKEMLPTDKPSVLAASPTALDSQLIVGSNNNGQTNSRTPPSDSKSQILIKACQHIKAMQDEINSLRECLAENENLRLSNQRLQNELNKLRTECDISLDHSISSNPNSNFNVTLNTLNSNGLFDVSSAVAAVGAAAAITVDGVDATLNPFTKRELIIRDYVD